MNYCNNNTCESDISYNDSFRIDKISPTSDIAKALEDVFFGMNPPDSSDTARQYFDCSPAGIEILALLAHYDGYMSSPSRISELLHKKELSINSVLMELSYKGLINQVPDSEAIILTRHASMAIAKSTPVSELKEKEFIEALKEKEDDDLISSNSVLQRVNVFLKSNPQGTVKSFVEKYQIDKLTDAAQELFWKICGHYVENFIDPFPKTGKAAMKELSKLGLVESVAMAENNELTTTDNYCLSSKAAAKLFAGKEDIINYASTAAIGRFVPWKEIEEKPLFFCDSDKDAIRKLERMAGESEYDKICEALSARKLRVSLSAILHGPAGTGKTELTMQIARKTRRNIIMVDAAKLHGSFWGEDERNFREMFRIFRHIEALSERPPILFIDECEGLLGKRVANASTRGDRSTNIVQNILLEELNSFRGLLFVTTNDVTNIDKAMDRRFLMKIEFHIPDEKTRKALWQSKIPELPEDAAAGLARQFVFSGGHIDNIATKAFIDEAIDDVSIDYDLLCRYCQDEQSFTSMSTSRTIGF